MSAYAVGLLKQVNFGSDIEKYIKGIDETLKPYHGRFLIHGQQPEVMEGTLQEDVVAIEFPDIGLARKWYRSNAYQEILPLRAKNSESVIFLVDGLPPEHCATDILK